MVQLAPYLAADSVESYCTDPSTATTSRPSSIRPSWTRPSRSRRSIPSDLMTLLRGWAEGFCPLNAIERSLSDLIDARESDSVDAHGGPS